MSNNMKMDEFLNIFKNETIPVPILPGQTEKEAMEVAANFYSKMLSDVINNEILDELRRLGNK